jgi:hypothetical protein
MWSAEKSPAARRCKVAAAFRFVCHSSTATRRRLSASAATPCPARKARASVRSAGPGSKSSGSPVSGSECSSSTGRRQRGPTPLVRPGHPPTLPPRPDTMRRKGPLPRGASGRGRARAASGPPPASHWCGPLQPARAWRPPARPWCQGSRAAPPEDAPKLCRDSLADEIDAGSRVLGRTGHG